MAIRKKIIPVLFVTIIVGSILAIPSTPIENKANASASPKKDPSHHSMAKHLESVHGVRMGNWSGTDIRLRVEGDYIRVTFQPDFLGRLEENALLWCEMEKPDVFMSEDRFNTFLFLFHAYLTATPARPR